MPSVFIEVARVRGEARRAEHAPPLRELMGMGRLCAARVWGCSYWISPSPNLSPQGRGVRIRNAITTTQENSGRNPSETPCIYRTFVLV